MKEETSNEAKCEESISDRLNRLPKEMKSIIDELNVAIDDYALEFDHSRLLLEVEEKRYHRDYISSLINKLACLIY